MNLLNKILNICKFNKNDAATEQIIAKQYIEPFKAGKRKVTAIAIELDDKGKGLVAWKEV